MTSSGPVGAQRDQHDVVAVRQDVARGVQRVRHGGDLPLDELGELLVVGLDHGEPAGADRVGQCVARGVHREGRAVAGGCRAAGARAKPPGTPSGRLPATISAVASSSSSCSTAATIASSSAVGEHRAGRVDLRGHAARVRQRHVAPGRSRDRDRVGGHVVGGEPGHQHLAVRAAHGEDGDGGQAVLVQAPRDVDPLPPASRCAPTARFTPPRTRSTVSRVRSRLGLRVTVITPASSQSGPFLFVPVSLWLCV